MGLVFMGLGFVMLGFVVVGQHLDAMRCNYSSRLGYRGIATIVVAVVFATMGVVFNTSDVNSAVAGRKCTKPS